MNDLERKIKEIDIDNMRDQISSLYNQMKHSIDIMKDFTKSNSSYRNIADRYGFITEDQVKLINNNNKFKVCLPLLYKINTIMTQENFENSKYVRAVEKVQKLRAKVQ